MNRYDWGWNRPYDRDRRPRPRRMYGSDYRSWGTGWGMVPGGGWGQGAAFEQYQDDLWEREGFGVGYDRGVYGGGYPGYGGYPDSHGRGLHYGGRGYAQEFTPRYDRGFARPPQRGGYDPGYGQTGFAREPFVPETAYQRHPELDRPQRHSVDRWPDAGHNPVGQELSDEEIRRSVRQNLFNDNWIDAERIQVEVDGQVVTLKGEVDDYIEARYAWDDAWEAAGVRGVINQLAVRLDESQEAHGDVVPQTAGGKKK